MKASDRGVNRGIHANVDDDDDNTEDDANLFLEQYENDDKRI